MDKRYQVFVSSTFSDLKQERQSVLTAILELDHMPAGMELFPAGDDSAWQLIEDVIDSSDYYVLIIGGRYGSLDEAGLGYTEKEYDYAISTKRPVIPFLHAAPDNLPRDKTETDQGAWDKLKAFRAKVEKRHTCVYWKTAEELKAKVIVGMTSAMKRHPAVGWVRADRVPSDATVNEILLLRKRISDLEAALNADVTKPPKGTEDLQQGDDLLDVPVGFVSRDPDDNSYGHPNDERFTGVIHPTWHEIFAAVAPTMINETSDAKLRSDFKTFFGAQTLAAFRPDKRFKKRILRDPSCRDDTIDTCIVQFRALGLIRENQKARSVKDTRTYWTLTPYGDQLMTQLRALRRAPGADTPASPPTKTD